MEDTAQRIDEMIFALLSTRDADATICPSEVARAIARTDWRPLMPTVRAAAQRLAREGRLDIRQRGLTVRIGQDLRGPIRLALPRR